MRELKKKIGMDIREMSVIRKQQEKTLRSL